MLVSADNLCVTEELKCSVQSHALTHFPDRRLYRVPTLALRIVGGGEDGGFEWAANRGGGGREATRQTSWSKEEVAGYPLEYGRWERMGWDGMGHGLDGTVLYLKL